MGCAAQRSKFTLGRSITQIGFFTLFVLAPPLDIFRYDLTLGHFILLGQDWTLRLDALHGVGAGSFDAALHVLFLGLLPILLVAVGFLWVAWRWGRVYCGWFCPHFSIVEVVNNLMRRATGKPGLWEKQPLPEKQPDGSIQKPNAWYWLPTIGAVLAFAVLWSVSLLTYLLPPFEIYSNILHMELTRNQALFLGVATTVFSLEFLVTRHLFCRFGCAVGLFQSLAWMSNRRALVIAFDTRRAQACRGCNNACDNACPMRLQPRTLKRRMFTCTECGECITACATVQGGQRERSLLQWVQGDDAEKLSEPPMEVPVKLSRTLR